MKEARCQGTISWKLRSRWGCINLALDTIGPKITPFTCKSILKFSGGRFNQ